MSLNWDRQFKLMADAFLKHITSGNALDKAILDEAKLLLEDVKRQNGDTRRMCEIGVKWVAQNSIPVKLPRPDYDR